MVLFVYLRPLQEQENPELPKMQKIQKTNENQIGQKPKTEPRNRPPIKRDADVRHKQNNGIFEEEEFASGDMEQKMLEKKAKIEKFQNRRSFWSKIFGSWFGNEAAVFSSEHNY